MTLWPILPAKHQLSLTTKIIMSCYYQLCHLTGVRRPNIDVGAEVTLGSWISMPSRWQSRCQPWPFLAAGLLKHVVVFSRIFTSVFRPIQSKWFGLVYEKGGLVHWPCIMGFSLRKSGEEECVSATLMKAHNWQNGGVVFFGRKMHPWVTHTHTTLILCESRTQTYTHTHTL